MFNRVVSRTGLPTGSTWIADPVQKAKMDDFSYKNSRTGSAVMPKHHKSHLLLIFCPSGHCGAPGNSLMVINRVLSRTGSADRVDPVGRPGFEGEKPWKIQNFWCSGAGSHRRMLWDRSVDVLGVRGRLHSASSSPTVKIWDISLFSRKIPVWGSPFWRCTPYFRGLYLRAQRESDNVPDM